MVWGLAGEAATVLLSIAVLGAAPLSTLQLSDTASTTEGFVSTSVHTRRECRSRTWQGTLPGHSNRDCSGQHAVSHEDSSSTPIRIKCTGTSKGRGRYHDDS